MELARDDRLGEPTDVRGLLSRKPSALQGGVLERGDASGIHSTRNLLEPRVGRAPGGERDLLLENDLHERLESRWTVPQRRDSVARDDRCEVRVAPRELGHAFGQRVIRQLERHVNLTKHRTAS